MATERTEAQVGPGAESHLTGLHHHSVRETPITCGTSVFTPEERRPWLLSHLEDGWHRLKVAAAPDSGEIPGHTTPRPYRARPRHKKER